MNDEEKKNEVLDQEKINNPGLTKKQEKALRRKEFFKFHPKLAWFYDHMTLSAILFFFFVLFVVFFFRGCTEDTTKYNSSIQIYNSSLVESTPKKAWVYDEETDTITSDNLIIFDDLASVDEVGVTRKYENGSIYLNGTATGNKLFFVFNHKTFNTGSSFYGQIFVCGIITPIDSTQRFLLSSRTNSYSLLGTTSSIGLVKTNGTNASDWQFAVIVKEGDVFNNVIIRPMLVQGTIAPTAWTPGGTYVNKTEYDDLLSSYNTLQENYNNLVTSHQNLQNEYNTLNTNYNNLNSEYQNLQTSYNALQTQYNKLQTLYDNLVSSFNELNGSNAFEFSNLDDFVFVTTDSTTMRLPNQESKFLGSSLPLYYTADKVKYTYNTPVYFKQGTIVGLSTTYTFQHPVAVKISLYDSNNSLIGDFGITFNFSTISATGVYGGSYEFASDVGNISSIVFTDNSLNDKLGVTSFDLASDPYKRGYNNGYLARSDDYYQMLNNYNQEVEKYNALYDEYQTYKETYNSAVVASARAAGIEEGANADNALSDGFLAVFNAPFALVYRLLDFNVLGLNMWVLAVSLCSIVVAVKLVKVIL